MALKAILETLDDVPEALHGEYKQQKIGDKTVYTLDVEGVDDHPAVANLKSAYERVKADKAKLTNDLKDATTKLGTFPDGFDPAEWDRLKAEDEARQADPDNKNERAKIDAATAAVEQRYRTQQERRDQAQAAALAEKDTIISAQDTELRNILVRDGLKAALATAGVKKGLISAAVAQFEHDAEVLVEDGRRVARMKADLGGEMIDKYIANWAQSDAAKDFIEPLKGADEVGSGRARGSFDNNPFGKNHWNKTEQGKLIRDDRSRAEQMAKAAGFKSLDQTYTASGPLAA